MAISHEIKVTFRDGTEVDTFDEYAITLDMLQPGSAWTLALWLSDSQRRTAGKVVREKAKLGEQLYFAIDGAVQISGMIEVIDDNSDREGADVLILSGRDLSGIAIDWDADPTIHLRNSNLEDALIALFAPLNYSLFLCEAAAMRDVQALTHRRRGASARRARRTSSHIDRFKIQPGAKVWATADRICKQAGYLLWTGPYPEEGAGIGVIVDKPVDSGEPVFRFERVVQQDGTVRGNILRRSYRGSIRGIPTEVTAFTHTALTAGQDTRIRSVRFNDGLSHPLVVDDPLPQPLYLRADQANTADRARRESERAIARAMAGFRTYECTVQGHGQDLAAGRRLYTLNTLARVRDDTAGRDGLDEDFLITQLAMRGSRTMDQVTTARMSPKGAIVVTPDE
jgi:prophage tail gpP-like protein